MSSKISNAANKLVVILGVGPGTGFALAKRFALAGHPVALLARQKSRLTEMAEEINGLGGKASCFAVDATEKQSIDAAFTDIERQFADGKTKIWGGIYNPGAFLRSPLLDVSEEQVRNIVDVQFFGGFFFAQSLLKALKLNGQSFDTQDEALGFLAFTGATASVKGSANFGAFSASKGAIRNLAQSTAREFHPQGVHVCHVIVDGIIDTQVTQSWLGDKFEPNTRMKSDDIAETFHALASQKKSAWTHEIDLRPFSEKF